MATERLTIRRIDALVPLNERYTVWDEELTGLGVRVSPKSGRFPNGRKLFILYYRTADGVERRPTLGALGQMTLEQARDEARNYLAKVRLGADPSAERQNARAAATVDELADRYLREHAKVHKKPSSATKDEQNLKLHVRTRFGSRKITSITSVDVERMHHEMLETPGAANRVLALFSKMMNLAEKWRLRPEHSNPCRHVTKYAERKVHHDLSEIETARLAKILRDAEDAHARIRAERPREKDRDLAAHPTATDAVRLLLLTGCRRGEVLGLGWNEVDLERKALRFLDSKGGAKTIALNAPALALLEARPRIVGSPWVFPSPKNPAKHLVGLPKIWHRLRKRAGLEKMRDGAPFRLHDLRHNLASYGASEGLNLLEIGKLLGHRVPATTARYAELVDAAQAKVSNRVGATIAKAMGSRKKGGKS